MLWIRRRLAIRQTVYAVAAVAVLATAIAIVEIVFAYQDEHDRVESFVAQLADAFLDTSARAAFHVDSAQAGVVLDGLMNFDSVATARISTDLGELLAERTRTRAAGSMDPLSRWLFDDIASHQSILVSATTRVPAGTLFFRISPELIGQGFMNTLGTRIAALAVEFLILASVLAVVFHRTLIRPLTTYANDIKAIDHRAVEIPSVAVPRGHEIDELGQVVSQTNGLLAQISEQREGMIHREKIAALGSMLAGAAHELNNPLAVVIAQTQMLKETSTNRDVAERADKILKPAERCATIIRSFLELARQRKTNKTPADIADVIQDAVELAAYRLKTHGVELNVEVAAGIPTVAVDAMQISQAVLNLLINAEQALVNQPPPRLIDLLVTFEGNELVVTVSDNGPGIPAELLERVAEPFFTTKPEGRGTGLGLTFCSNVAASHRGTLDISRRQPRGTVATLTIAAELADLLPSQPATSGDRVIGLNVLVVDDEESLTESFAEALRIRGHDVETGFEGTTGLYRIASKPFDVIVADVRMPGISGIEMFERAEREHPGLSDRFIFITGEPVTDAIASFLDERHIPCLSKPVDLDDLATTVEQRGVAARVTS